MLLDSGGGDQAHLPLVCSLSLLVRAGRLQARRVKSAAACRLIKIIPVSFIGISTGGWQEG